ncbi:transposase [Granulosicoccus antarcticus]|uniref:Transposase IS4-like domain-containing protein n=1 Tax=Granulosicoccus antarcticus IMCC3135 TaxID=1192854 RepID=A0A2Z2NX98_9GAMM|nr:transposase [Granulosicoccus antarcticus]ASJ74601.1 hypothetical protein IMCC3135_22655 [Granulosicoccus antarcticus IMCC3135]
MAAPFARFRPDVSMPGLLTTVRTAFDKVNDKRRQASVQYSMSDSLMAGLAIFSLKYPSLLMFDQHARSSEPVSNHNLRTLFGLSQVPCDSQMRAILDPVNPSELRGAFRAIHSGLQRSNSLKDFQLFNGKLLLSIDGTGTFSSTRISCKHCCVKKPKRNQKSDEGSEFYHQMLGAVIVHPERSTVLPLDFEPITRADGSNKNDCERNAGKRLIASLAAQYPKRGFIVIEDALAANGPHLKTLIEHRMDFIIVAKPGSNAALFETLDQRMKQGELQAWETVDEKTGLLRGYRICEQVPLNNTHTELLVNCLEYYEIDRQGKEHNWQWISSLQITPENAEQIMRAGRARWKIENETFNAAKNQGYHMGHSYGHGKQYLSSVLGGLMFLAFLIDQVQESFCRVFGEIRIHHKSRRNLWERLRAAFTTVKASEWEGFMRFWHKPGDFAFEIPSDRPT